MAFTGKGGRVVQTKPRYLNRRINYFDWVFEGEPDMTANDIYDRKDRAEEIVAQLQKVLQWNGGRKSPLHSASFFKEFDKLVELYDDLYGGHEELT